MILHVDIGSVLDKKLQCVVLALLTSVVNGGLASPVPRIDAAPALHKERDDLWEAVRS